MSLSFLLRFFGQGWLANQIKSGLDHRVSAQGKQQLGASLQQAGTALQSGDTATAANAIAAVLVSIK